MFGPGIAISASAARANSASVDGAGIARAYRSERRAKVGARMIARVEPLTTTRRLNGPFDYRVTDGVDVGTILEIPFGHQTLEGVVVELTEHTDVPDEKLVAPRSARPDTLPRDLVDLALWLGEEYCSTPARALALVTPPPGKAKTSLWAQPTGAEGKLTDNQAELLARLPGPTGADLP